MSGCDALALASPAARCADSVVLACLALLLIPVPVKML
jgi:predicted Co/Zn/Cd cation transporter (cation efflux family)